VGESVHIAGAEDKTPAELEWVLAQLVLPMSGSFGALARCRIVLSQKVKQRCFAEFRRAICLPLLVNQKRESYSGLLTEGAGVVQAAESDCGNARSLAAEFLFVFAQLRDVLAAEDSTPVSEKHQYHWSRCPESAQRNLLPLGVWQSNSGKPATEGRCGRRCLCHRGGVILR